MANPAFGWNHSLGELCWKGEHAGALRSAERRAPAERLLLKQSAKEPIQTGQDLRGRSGHSAPVGSPEHCGECGTFENSGSASAV